MEANIRIDPRQLGGLMTAILSEIAPNKTVELPTTMKREGAKRVRVYYGPFEILGAEAAKKTINRNAYSSVCF
jgi:hypothetical protein